jgi:hypothetical protein
MLYRLNSIVEQLSVPSIHYAFLTDLYICTPILSYDQDDNTRFRHGRDEITNYVEVEFHPGPFSQYRLNSIVEQISATSIHYAFLTDVYLY